MDTSIVGAGVDPALTSSSMTETCFDEVIIVTVVDIDVLEEMTRSALGRGVATFKGADVQTVCLGLLILLTLSLLDLLRCRSPARPGVS